jgi:cyclic beta-1,2-glucan synthetase
LHEGRGAWTWYSGSAAWLYQCTIENLLGIKVENDELVVRPNIPANWNGFTAERLFRGKNLRITVKRAGPAGSGSEFATTIESV